MALVACPECSSPISSEAAQCPQCHLPNAGPRGVELALAVDERIKLVQRLLMDRPKQALERTFVTVPSRWPHPSLIARHGCFRGPNSTAILRLKEIDSFLGTHSFQCGYCNKGFFVARKRVDPVLLNWLQGWPEAEEPQWMTGTPAQ